MNSQSPGNPNRDNFVGEFIKYYMGEGGGFPRVRAMMSKVSPCCPWLVPTPRLIQNEN
jgi:hypothetical protein